MDDAAAFALLLSGQLSYCLYLVHLSLSDGYEYLLRRYDLSPIRVLGAPSAFLLRAIVIVVASFAIALLSRKYLEGPCLALKDRYAATADTRGKDQENRQSYSLTT